MALHHMIPFKIKDSIGRSLESANIVLRFEFPRPAVREMKKAFQAQELSGAEIGTWKGDHARSIMKELNIKKLYLVDPYEHYEEYDNIKFMRNTKLIQARKSAEKKMKKYGDKAEFVHELSEKGASTVTDKLDFVYIDGNHSFKHAKQDMELWWEKLKSGGVLCGHDVDGKGVISALLEFTRKRNLNFRAHTNDWWIVKE